MISLRYEVGGPAGAPPVLLVHGWCCARGNMAGLGAALADRFRVYRVDLPGHGESPRVPGGPSLESYAQALGDFLGEHGLDRVTLVGHSMGGVLSVLTAGAFPDRVAAVVNLDGSVPLAAKSREGFEALLAQVEREGFRPTMAAFFRESFFLPQERGPVMEEIVALMLSAPEDLARQLLPPFPALDGRAALARCRAPLLYVAGAHSRYDADAARAVRPEMRFGFAGLCGHFLHVFALERVTALVRDFLDSQ